jgi:hypothetical protein
LEISCVRFSRYEPDAVMFKSRSSESEGLLFY